MAMDKKDRPPAPVSPYPWAPAYLKQNKPPRHGFGVQTVAGIERSKLRLTSAAEKLSCFGEKDAHDTRCKTCGSLLYSVVRDGKFVHVTLGTRR